MKTSEDNLNEALRAVLKRKFDDYEELPNPSAFGNILARLKPVRRWRYLWLAWSALVISIIAIGTKEYLGAAKEGGKVLQQSRKVVPVPTERPSENAVLPIRPPLTVPAHSGTGPLKVGLTNAAASRNNKKVSIGHTSVDHKRLRIEGKSLGDDAKNETKYLALNAAVPEKPVVDGLPPQILDLATPPDERQGGFSPPENGPEVANPELALEPLDPIASDGLHVHMQQRSVHLPPKPELKREIAVNPSKITWLANAAVLHTYQILTVPSSAAKDFQNFSFPSVFTLKSMGFKLSAGAEKKGLQLQLHYSGFRQSYSYEVANDSYLVKPDANGSYKTVRQGDKINEESGYSLLGIGISKMMRWGRSPYSRFYATAGLEYSQSLKDSRSLGWFNLGIGKQIAVSRKSALHIGPYAEFSPMKISGTGNPFFYQPYRVGISMGLRFVRP